MRWSAPLVALAILFASARAHAGGFEIPDNGTEALGRGGAFVAKADDGSAMVHNLAGLARQEGFRLTIDANLILHDFTFESSGFRQTDMTGAVVPSAGAAGMPGPKMGDSSRLFFAPMAAASFDLGRLSKKLHHLVIGLGVFGPSSVGNHNYGVGAPSGAPDASDPNNTCHTAKDTSGNPYPVCDNPPATVDGKAGGAFAPSRYDIATTNLLIVLPTLAVAWRPHRVIDVGLGWQMVFSTFDLANANVVSGVAGPQDAYGRIRTSGNSFSSSSGYITSSDAKFTPGIGSFGWLFSVLLHPAEWMDIGLHYRTPISVHTEGTLHPISSTATFPDGPATFSTNLPMFLRAGARLVKHYADGTERADLELDVVWENWSAERADHVHGEDLTGSNPLWNACVSCPDTATLPNGKTATGIGSLDADVIHNYRDTFGVRLGGAYNYRIRDDMRLTGRLGVFYDSSATAPKDTRLDFNTLDKIGFTVGGGFRMKGFTVNLGYAYLYSPSRTVTDSQVYAISAASGSTIAPAQRVIIGNGTYAGYFHVLSVGLTFNFSEFKNPTLFAH